MLASTFYAVSAATRGNGQCPLLAGLKVESHGQQTWLCTTHPQHVGLVGGDELLQDDVLLMEAGDRQEEKTDVELPRQPRHEQRKYGSTRLSSASGGLCDTYLL
jgi:hypothetical protein